MQVQIDPFNSFVCKLHILDLKMFIHLHVDFLGNLKDVIFIGNLTWPEMGKQTNETEEVYSSPHPRLLVQATDYLTFLASKL